MSKLQDKLEPGKYQIDLKISGDFTVEEGDAVTAEEAIQHVRENTGALVDWNWAKWQ